MSDNQCVAGEGGRATVAGSRKVRAVLGAVSLAAACVLPVGMAAPAHAATARTFTSNGTFTVPQGVTGITVTLVAAGPGGSGGGASGWERSELDGELIYSGGGGGARVTCTLTVTPGQVLTLGVGGNGSPRSALEQPDTA
ncbi:hypothetical protein [Streptomyces spectabilis]|uniref:Uncharacterized protein n=1 Tax=Streptomyces spectabilis TaxID=68270 RepID=A0A516RJW0_STRST|nr:hypothetical protein [Streptomyces spectabilis]QDQ15956.1 hypothetical protein FH965_39905 [Streptomyces spectabilis]